MSRVQVRAEERRGRRGDVLVVVGALALGAVLAWIVLSVQGVTQDLRVEREYSRALAQQVRDMGGRPVKGPPGEPGVSVTGPTGPQGEKGDPGEPAPTLTPSPGASGAPGKDGEDGADGSDSTVPGPTGPAGPPGADSTVPGPSGPPGRDGRDGVDGADGQSCPDGYSLQAPSYDPDALVCRRDGAPDPDEPGKGNPQAEGALDPQRRVYA